MSFVEKYVNSPSQVESWIRKLFKLLLVLSYSSESYYHDFLHVALILVSFWLKYNLVFFCCLLFFYLLKCMFFIDGLWISHHATQ